MSAPTEEKPPKPPARIVVTFRMGAAGKTRAQAKAEEAGYKHYTAWVRDLIAAETMNPKHNLTPKQEDRRG